MPLVFSFTNMEEAGRRIPTSNARSIVENFLGKTGSNLPIGGAMTRVFLELNT